MSSYIRIRLFSVPAALEDVITGHSFECGALGVTEALAFSQPDSIPLYKQYPFVPAFKLMKSDSSYFQIKDVIKKKKPTVVIIFSPTCNHCQHQAEEITSHIKDLKDVTFIFSTVYPVDEMKQYISAYGLDKFPNIHVGHDKGYIMGTFYKITSLPGIFVYDKKGKLLAGFDTNIKVDKLLETLKK